MLGPAPEQEQWNEWLHHPCTKYLRNWAQQQRERLKEGWAKGQFAAAFTMEMAVKNAAATGACSAFEDLIELDYNQIVTGELPDEKQQWPDPSGESSVG